MTDAEAEDFYKAQEDAARRIAHIVGATSAAGAALRDLARRRNAGESVVIFHTGRRWLVGPRPELSPQGVAHD